MSNTAKSLISLINPHNIEWSCLLLVPRWKKWVWINWSTDLAALSHTLTIILLFHTRIILNIKPGVASIFKKCIWWQYYLIQCRKPQNHNSKIQKIKKKKPIFVEKSMFPKAKAEKVHQSFSDQRINKLLLWWIITNFPYKNVNLALASPLGTARFSCYATTQNAKKKY